MQMDVHRSADRPFSDVDDLGVVISEQRRGQQHIGILYKAEDGTAMVCDLAWHRLIRNQPPSEESDRWIQSGLDRVNRMVVAVAVEGTVAAEKPPISYSPLYEGVYFTEGDLSYERDKPGDGLTCATFVMAIFEPLGFPLLMTETWKSRQSDNEWRENILASLERWATNHGCDVTEHVAAIRQSSQSVRYRPEEVAAGVGVDNGPIPFEVAEPLGRRIVAALRSRGINDDRAP